MAVDSVVVLLFVVLSACEYEGSGSCDVLAKGVVDSGDQLGNKS